LDLAFDIHNSEIQSNVVESKSFRYDMDGILESVGGQYNEYLHGTAVAEIITDVAPDVSLHLYSFGTELEFADAVDYAIQKVDLIAMSAGWMTFPTDGSTLMTSKVEDSVNSGVPFILSAGNSAEMHWQGNYVDTDGNGWHEFASGDEGISISATADRVSNQFSITAYLMWADLPSDYVNDFDLALIGPEGDIVTHSSNVQSHKDNAFEWISFVPDVVGTYHIGITYSGSGSPPDVLEIFSPTDLLEYHTIPSSVTVPTDADGAIVVGAIYHVDDSLESFSSNGPTNNGNKTPTVVAPDGVTTDAYDTEPFYGTSAAAPHVAGIVALLLEQNPDITPAEILSMLEDNADAESVGLTSTSDNAFGFGKADAYNLIGGSELEIPDWIKNNADWWSQGLIDDDSFVNGIQFMITNGIIVIPDLPESSGSGGEVPDWVRNNAEWWAQNLITDEDFVMGIEFLVKNGIIVV
jgi:subtilisin family serine protease